MSRADRTDGADCEECGGWVDYADLGSVAYHEHDGRGEPWGMKGERMPERKKYRMSDEHYADLMKACKPVVAIALQCGMPSSPQENANAEWAHIGKAMGFRHMTVEPDGPDNRNFTAVPTDA